MVKRIKAKAKASNQHWLLGTVSALSLLTAVSAKADSVTVKEGDTVWDLANQYQTTVEAIEQANPTIKKVNNSVDLIYTGQSLQLSAKSNHAKDDHLYTVKPGDTLSAISQKLHVSVADLVAWNHLTTPDQLVVGQQLAVDGDTKAPQAPVQTETQATPVTVTPAPNSQSAQVTPVQTPADNGAAVQQSAQSPASATPTQPAQASTTPAPQATTEPAQSTPAPVQQATAQSVQNTPAPAPQSTQSTPAPAQPQASAEPAQSTPVPVQPQATTEPAQSAPAPAPQATAQPAQSTPAPVQQATAEPTQSTSAPAQQAGETSAQPQASAESAQPAQPETQATPAQQANNNQNADLQSGSVVSLAVKLANANIPYVWGGSSLSGMDCSGLVSYVYQNAEGVSLPHYTVALENYVSQHPVSQAQAGDILFWGDHGSTYHCAIYIGNNQYVAAPQPGQNVEVESISPYFAPSFAGTVNK